MRSRNFFYGLASLLSLVTITGVIAQKYNFHINHESEILENVDSNISKTTSTFSVNSPQSCPPPISLSANTVGNITEFTWIPAGSEIQWQIIIQVEGAIPPGNNVSGENVYTIPSYTADFIIPDVGYDVYIRAICADGEVSSWTNSFNYYAPPANDSCLYSKNIPVSTNEQCISNVEGEFSGTTASPEPDYCGNLNNGDIWFDFTAINSVHAVQLSDFSGSNLPIMLTLYQGDDCNNLNRIFCSSVNYITATGLITGQKYYVRASINSNNPSKTITFKICVNTPDISGGGNSFECLINTINSDFESPDMNGSWGMYNHHTVQGWRTTATDEIIEYWGSGFNDVPAYSGNQFIELNANMASGVYQDFDTPVTTEFNFGFAHRGRLGIDSCGLYAGPPGGPYQLVLTATTGNSDWVYYTGSYTVPVGQTQTRFIFEAISASGGLTVGNFLDAITFTANNGILSENPMNMDCGQDTSSVILAAGSGTWIAHSDNPSATVIDDANSNTPVITGFSVTGTYRYEWTTLYCTSTLEINYTGNSIPEPEVENVVYCVGQEATSLVVVPLFTHEINWYSQPEGVTALTEAPTPDTSVSGITTYYVSQTSIYTGCEGPRAPITITVNELYPLQITGLEYNSNQFCLLDIIIFPSINITPLGGVFSASNNLTIDAETGAIDLNDVQQGTYTITYTVAENINNCTQEGIATFEITFNEPQTPQLNISYTTPVCQSENNLFPTVNLLNGIFQSTQGLIIDELTGEINVSSSIAGTYLVTYIINEDLENCLLGATASFSVTILPEAEYSIYQECLGTSSWLFVDDNNNNNQTNYTWYDQNGNIVQTNSNSFNISEYLNQNPSVTIPSNGIIFSASLDENCGGIAEFTVTAAFCSIPKGISPNGDFLNDDFNLDGLGATDVKIFNRYGTIVYDFSGNYTNQWKGQSNKGEELPTATYYYAISTKSGTTYTGWVYLNR